MKPTSSFTRRALQFHGLYFIIAALFFGFMPHALLTSFNLVPVEGFLGQLTATMAGGLFFSFAALLIFASVQPQVPRFIYVVALIQTAINLYHDARWIIQFGNTGQIGAFIGDAVIISILFVTYLVAFRKSAPALVQTA